MANRLRKLDPQASPAAQFGAELRELRTGRGLSLAALGRLVHVSGDLLGKIEKAERRPQADLARRLDHVLEADGWLDKLVDALNDDVPVPADSKVALPPEITLPVLRQVINTARTNDHAMSEHADVSTLIAHARAAERVHGHVDREVRPQLHGAIGEAYQLAGWMSFDHGRPARAENLLSTSRTWVERADDPALAAFVLGPNMSFTATHGGKAELGVERAYGAMGWARRSGNRRLTAFTMAIGARAHARLGETALSLGLIEQAHDELDRHVPDERDNGWLAVFDRAALDGHRGSCLLDLGMPDRALTPLGEQDRAAPRLFVRNRVIWQLDRVEALLRLGEIDQVCAELRTATGIPTGSVTARVRRRFRVIELQLRALPCSNAVSSVVDDATERLREITAVHE